MSRAFVKEQDGDQAEEILEKPQSKHPNYVTKTGYAKLKLQLEELRNRYREIKTGQDNLLAKNQLKKIEADLRYLEKRVQSAIPVDVAAQTAMDIRFGASVMLLDENDQNYYFTIVGEDEADAANGLISWVSPLARELIGKQTGDTLIWKKPSGDVELEITGFDYL